MQCGNIASRTNGAGCIYIRNTHVPYVYINYTPRCNLKDPRNINILGECSALWGEREGVVWCIIVFHSTTFSHLHTSHITIVSFPGLLHLPSVACKTTGEECLGKRLYMISSVCEAILLGYVVHCTHPVSLL